MLMLMKLNLYSYLVLVWTCTWRGCTSTSCRWWRCIRTCCWCWYTCCYCCYSTCKVNIACTISAVKSPRLPRFDLNFTIKNCWKLWKNELAKYQHSVWPSQNSPRRTRSPAAKKWNSIKKRLFDNSDLI